MAEKALTNEAVLRGTTDVAWWDHDTMALTGVRVTRSSNGPHFGVELSVRVGTSSDASFEFSLFRAGVLRLRRRNVGTKICVCPELPLAYRQSSFLPSSPVRKGKNGAFRILR